MKIQFNFNCEMSAEELSKIVELDQKNGYRCSYISNYSRSSNPRRERAYRNNDNTSNQYTNDQINSNDQPDDELDELAKFKITWSQVERIINDSLIRNDRRRLAAAIADISPYQGRLMTEHYGSDSWKRP